MAMQTDVKSYHAKASGQIIGFESRLKSVVVASATVSLRNIALCDSTGGLTGTWSRTSTTVTVTTSTNHGLTTGDRVAIDFSSGSTIRDGVYAVTVTGLDTFEVTSVTSGSATGTCSVFTSDNIILEVDTYSTVSLPILIPGEGIRCQNGIYAVLGSSVTATIYYG
jgi:hypothetical protein